MDACTFFRTLSTETWDRISLAWKAGLSISEPTITQNILFRIYRNRRYIGRQIKIFESTDEKTNGNDLEIALRISYGYVKLPAQCKIIKKSGSYRTLQHKNQINDLIAYASKPDVRGFPVYLFYNSYQKPFSHPSTICSLPVTARDFGLTFVSAAILKASFATRGLNAKGHQLWNIPGFKDLHPNFCMPFWRMICCLKNFESELLKTAIQSKSGDIKIYPPNELLNDPEWIPFSLHQRRDSIEVGVRKKSTSGFNPKFRIVIGS